MLRSTLRGGAAPLVITVLVALAGCGPTFETEVDDAAACAGVRCTAGTCFSNAGQPMCRCGPWEDSAGLVCQVSSFVTPDDYGGSPEEATPLSLLDGPREGRISASTRGQSDRDLFSFEAKAGHTYFFFCEPVSLLRCLPRLLDGSGRQVKSFPLDSRRTAWILTSLPEGTWYVEVSSDGGAAGSYTYQLVDMGLDDFSNGPDSASVREPSEVPFKVTSTFLGDDDVVRVDAVAGHAYRFGCELPSLDSGVTLRLLNSEGRGVDSVEGLGVRNKPQLDLKAAKSGPWFVEVSPKYGQPPMTFDCKLTDLGLDDHGDTPDSATPMTVDVPISVRMHSDKDVDELVFTADALHRYALRQQPAVPVNIQFFDDAGRRLGAIAPNSYLPVLVSGAGAYHLRVTPSGMNGQDVPFELTVVDVAMDDHPTYPSEATPSPLGVPIPVRAQFLSDFDALVFNVDGDGVYAVSCEPECTMSIGANGSRTNSAPQRVRTKNVNANGAASLSLTVLATSFLETHMVTVKKVGTDDFPGSASLAQPLTLPASGNFEAENDVEFFTVTLEAGRTYRVDASPSVGVFFSQPDGLGQTTSGTFVLTPWQTGTYQMSIWLPEGGFPGPWSLDLTPL
ncbi:hypothetical protein JY651_43835 [Pyxidicoccus parkwayensis]|uniref:Lipoprotein n=1 Tax=Pyxidicoccus parkwayensis TaxID=2813578 RepID=A0ABX7NX93_9BACT|nr:hypothetical protein [Pyxidicoccus parkwaysis]QSQ22006.1 hypothetical protein JY651_43835 [Pyxidicoccus parkwaysis]